MKNVRVFCFFLLLFFTFSLPQQDVESNNFDQYFASYGNISWKKEQVYLYNFALSLERESDLIGYIAFFVGTRDNPKKVMKRIKRAEEFLISKHKIDASRIIIINAGRKEETKIILQPVSKYVPRPTF